MRARAAHAADAGYVRVPPSRTRGARSGTQSKRIGPSPGSRFARAGMWLITTRSDYSPRRRC